MHSPSMPTIMLALPSLRMASRFSRALASILIPFSCRCDTVPHKTSLSSTLASTPLPGCMVKSDMDKSAVLSAEALTITALPNGCSERLSTDAQTCSKRSGLIPSLKGIILLTCKLPRVSVPVLSRAMLSTLPIFSSASPDFIITPCLVA